MSPTSLDWIESLVLGAVQGVTEFLPISSDGHLSITQKLFDALHGREAQAEENLFFIVLLHLGTLTALLIHYRRIGWAGARGLMGATDVATHLQRRSVIKAGIYTVIATLPAIPVGLLLKKQLEAAFASPFAAAVGFLITAAVLLVTTKLKGGEKGLDEMTWRDALLIGIAQSFAPLPGVSRSGLTISSALACGFSKSWAVGFSLLMAVPAILGGATLEFKDFLKPESHISLAHGAIWPMLAGTIVAGIVGYGAIVWLVRVVRSGKLWYFSVYLIVLGLGLLAYLSLRPGGERGQQVSTLFDRVPHRSPDQFRTGGDLQLPLIADPDSEPDRS